MPSLSNPRTQMASRVNLPRIDLPRGWPRYVKSAMLHVIALGQYDMAHSTTHEKEKRDHAGAQARTMLRLTAEIPP